MRPLVIIPTYNERENLAAAVEQVLALPAVSVLVVDDGSPDGTGNIADALAAGSGGRVSVLHRTGARGLGRSYVDGMDFEGGDGVLVVGRHEHHRRHPLDSHRANHVEAVHLRHLDVEERQRDVVDQQQLEGFAA